MKKLRSYFINGTETSEKEWMEEFNNEESLATLEIKQESIDTIQLLAKVKELEEENKKLKAENSIYSFDINDLKDTTIPLHCPY